MQDIEITRAVEQLKNVSPFRSDYIQKEWNRIKNFVNKQIWAHNFNQKVIKDQIKLEKLVKDDSVNYQRNQVAELLHEINTNEKLQRKQILQIEKTIINILNNIKTKRKITKELKRQSRIDQYNKQQKLKKQEKIRKLNEEARKRDQIKFNNEIKEIYEDIQDESKLSFFKKIEKHKHLLIVTNDTKEITKNRKKILIENDVKLYFGQQIEGRIKQDIIRNGKSVPIILLVKQAIKEYFEEGANLEIRTNVNFTEQRVSALGKIIKGNLVIIKDLDEFQQKGGKYFVTGSGSDENREASVSITPKFDYWTIHQIFQSGGALTSTKFNVHKCRLMPKKLNPLNFFPQNRKMRKYLCGNRILVDDIRSASDFHCLFKALQFFYINAKVLTRDGDTLSGKDLKIHLGIRQTDLIKISDISKIENLLGKTINVFDENLKIIYGIDKADINILLENIHYFAIVPSKNLKKIKQKHPIIIFFDFESITDNYDICIPYSWSLCGINIPTQNYIGENAMETFNRAVNKIFNKTGRKVVLVSYNGDRFDNIIYSEYLLTHVNYATNIAYEGTSVTNIKNFAIKGTIDLCKILTGSLRKNCIDYKLSKEVSKSSFDHSDAQKVYNKSGIKGIEEKYGKELLKYNDLDVISLRELYKITVLSMIDISKKLKIKIQPNILESKRTASSITKYLCGLYGKKNKSNLPGRISLPFTKENKKEMFKKSFSYYKKARASLYGGRSQMFRNKPTTVHNYGSIDSVSLYPSVMADNALDTRTGKIIDHYYPIGNIHPVKKLYPIKQQNHPLMKYLMGCYTIINLDQSNLKHNIIPDRTKDGLDWECKLIKKCELNTIDIAHLEMYGCKFEVCEGIVWDSFDNTHLGPYVTEIYKLKQEQDLLKATKDSKYNPSRRQQTKILLNSLFGKFCENLHEEYYKVLSEIKVSSITDEIEVEDVKFVRDKALISGKRKKEYFENHWEQLSKNHLITGSFILSYSRYSMYHLIKRFEENILYTDTDSIHIPKEDYETMKKEYPWVVIKDGKKILGQFENEFDDYKIQDENICHYIGKKMYCICDKNNKPIKYKMKGVSIKSEEGYGYYDNGVEKRFTKDNILRMYEKIKHEGFCKIKTIQWTRKRLINETKLGGIEIKSMDKTIKSKDYRKYLKLNLTEPYSLYKDYDKFNYDKYVNSLFDKFGIDL